MSTPVLRFAARSLAPLLLVVSWVLLTRGHHEPGGGFVGGLVAAAAVVFFALVFGEDEARRRLPLEPLRLAGVGLLLALLSGVPAALSGRPFLSGLWLDLALPAVGKAGTPLMFDVGVYLVVVGIATALLLELLRPADGPEVD